MKRGMSKVLSIVLSVAMLCTSVPTSAYAGGWGHGRGWWFWDYMWDDDSAVEEDTSAEDQSGTSDLEQDSGSEDPLFEEADGSDAEDQSQDGIISDSSDEEETETETQAAESEAGESGTEAQIVESETGESGTEAQASDEEETETETQAAESEAGESGTEAQIVESETGEAGTEAQTSDEEETESETQAAESEAALLETEVLSYTLPISAQLTADDLQVTVDAPAGAFPDGTTVTAQKVTLDDVDVDGTVLAAADITFIYDGAEVEPKDGAAVSVTIQSAEIAKADADTLSVVHVDDNNEVTPVADSDVQVQDDQVVFDASEFSVYAVVAEEGTTDENARATVNFYGKNKALIATVYVKNSDTLDELKTIVYDPGAGTLAENDMFLGWTTVENYDADSEAKRISEVRADLEKKKITEGDIVNYYAKIAEKAEVVYVAPNGVILNRESKLVYNDQPVDVTIDTNYTPETDAKGFLGWTVADVTSRANISSAVYEGNDVTAGGTEGNPYQVGTALKIIGNVTLNAYAPEGYWLVFDENGKGATYNAPQFVKSGAVTKEPSREMTRPGYDFKGWYTDEKCTDGKEFAFGSALTEKTTIYAKWVAKDSADYTVVIWKQNVDGKNYDFGEVITLTAPANSSVSPVNKVEQTDKAGADASYANIGGEDYQYEGFHLASYDQNVTVKPEGDSVVNVYFDRTQYTLTFKADTVKYSVTTDGWSLFGDNNQYGLVNGKYVKLSYELILFGNSYWYYNSNGEKVKYYGTRYRQTTVKNATVKTITALYGQNILDQFNPFTGDDGTQYDCTWSVSETPNGKFVTGYQLTFLNTMPADNAVFTSFTYSGRNAYTFNFYLENLPGGTEQYNLAKSYVINSDSLKSTKNEDFVAIEGFTQERSDPEYDSDGIYRFPYSDSKIDFYYSRNKHSIIYRDGTCFGKDTVAATEQILKQQDNIYYEAKIDSYGSYQPTKDGYTFAGWYVDSTCTVPYEFTGTMPDYNITVYAKWQQNEYRVFLHPNVDPSDDSLNWGSEDQAMNFRIYDGDKISLPTGLRHDYELVGWYSDEAITQVFSEDTRINSTTAETLAQDYDQTKHMTDPMDKYGNITGTGTNSDAEKGRTWITKEVNLYAKWRSKLNGAKGINIIYDANGGSNAPKDKSLYLDQALAIAQAASRAPNGKKFDHWVVQRWDEATKAYVDTDVTVEPGANFTVLKENAKAVELEGSTKDDPKYEYTVQLKAAYVDIETPTKTEIHWHSNVIDVLGNSISSYALTKPEGAVENEQLANDYIVTDVLAKDGTSGLEINKAVDIRSANTFSYAGMTFLGWAKTADATENDLFLKWDESTGKYTTTEGTEVKEVTQVAADLKNPTGNDLYAVWQGKFYIYHSGVAGDGNLKTVIMNHGQMPNGTYDLTKTVTKDTLYGGYYLDYAGKGSYKDDGKKGSDGVKYDGMNETWKLTDAQKASGKTLKPVAGETYYIKEVPLYYLLPRYEYTYTMADNKIQSMFLFSAIDDLNYSGIGFVVQEVNKPAKVYKSFTVKAANGTAQAKLTPTLLFGEEGLTSGGRLTEYRDDSLIKAPSFTVRPYWITMDGLKVLGSVERTVNMGDGTIDDSGISPTDNTVGATIQ